MKKLDTVLVILLVISIGFNVYLFTKSSNTKNLAVTATQEVEKLQEESENLNKEIEDLKSELNTLSENFSTKEQEKSELQVIVDELEKQLEEAKTVEVAVQETKEEEQKVETPTPEPTPQAQNTNGVDPEVQALLESLGAFENYVTETAPAGNETVTGLGITVE
ncbi:MAG: hypothetical protein IKM28_10070 [Lachnospiraceae bacterium]|nr:hypothetical protein [Lachnospiraceae bacterium]